MRDAIRSARVPQKAPWSCCHISITFDQKLMSVDRALPIVKHDYDGGSHPEARRGLSERS